MWNADVLRRCAKRAHQEAGRSSTISPGDASTGRWKCARRSGEMRRDPEVFCVMIVSYCCNISQANVRSSNRHGARRQHLYTDGTARTRIRRWVEVAQDASGKRQQTCEGGQ